MTTSSWSRFILDTKWSKKDLSKSRSATVVWREELYRVTLPNFSDPSHTWPSLSTQIGWESSFHVSVASRPAMRHSKQTAKSAAEHWQEMSSLNLNYSLQAWTWHMQTHAGMVRKGPEVRIWNWEFVLSFWSLTTYTYTTNYVLIHYGATIYDIFTRGGRLGNITDLQTKH